MPIFDLENEILIKPFYHTDFKDSLEKIVFKNQPETKGSILDKVFSEKQKTISSTIRSILDEIHLREALDLHLLQKINEDISWQRLQLEHLNSLKVQYFVELSNEVASRKTKVEKNIVELEQEKRKEYLECWNDLMELKKTLLLTLKDFWDVAKRQGLLSENFYPKENENRERS